MVKKELKLYALLDVDTLQKYKKSIEWFISCAKKNSAKLIQYRNKNGDKNQIINDLIKIKTLCNVPIVLNDELDLLDYADGIHLGQDDILKYEEDIFKASIYVKNRVKDKILGLSTHNKQEVLVANQLCVDYIGLGAYRQTSTKSVDNILGDSIDIIASYSKKDVAIIGGVKLSDTFNNASYIVVGSNLYEN